MAEVRKMATVGSVDVRMKITTNAQGAPYLSLQDAEVVAIDMPTAALEAVRTKGLGEGDGVDYVLISNDGEEYGSFEGVHPALMAALARRPNSKERTKAAEEAAKKK